ncbi:hypothetical protein MTO96_023293 [Rhipicephalus appendiculatus]
MAPGSVLKDALESESFGVKNDNYVQHVFCHSSGETEPVADTAMVGRWAAQLLHAAGWTLLNPIFSPRAALQLSPIAWPWIAACRRCVVPAFLSRNGKAGGNNTGHPADS